MNITYVTNTPLRESRFFHIHRFLPLIIFVGDILGIFIYLGVIFYLHVEQNLQSFTPLFYYFISWLFITLYLADLYNFKNNFDNLISLKKIAITYLVILSSAAFLIFISNIDDINSLLERQITLLNLSLLTTWALILRWIVVKCVRLQAQNSRWLILGIDENAIEFSQKFTSLNPYGKLAFITDSEKNDANLVKLQSEYLGNLQDLSLFERQNWSGIIVANDGNLSQLSLEQLLKMRLQGSRIHRLLDFYENLFGNKKYHPDCLILLRSQLKT
ncbi:MAG: hypothetical protein AAFX80_21640 [Cyanobacteria bacterium J06639_18]